jgi:hypothetical protein
MNFSYSLILEYLYERLRSIYNWTSELISEGVYANLLQVISYGLEQASLYAEILSKESIYKFAERINSVVAFAWILLYQPARKRGATTELTISCDPDFASYDAPKTIVYSEETVILRRWDVIVSEDGLNSVYLTEDVTYNNNTIVKHFNLPSSADGFQTSINSYVSEQKTNMQTVNLFGLVRIPVTLVTTPDVNPNNASVGGHDIIPGTLITIRNSQYFTGDFITQAYPPNTEDEKSYYVYIQTPYINQTLIEKISVSTTLSKGHVKVKAKEGIPSTFTYRATGVINEKIPIFSPNVDNTEIQAFRLNSNNERIEEITIVKDELFLIDDLSKYYCQVFNDPSFNYIYLLFGDNFRTKKLQAGEKIEIIYGETKGSTGNANKVKILSVFQNNPLSLSGSPITNLFVTNENPLLQGLDYETIPQIKNNSRKTFQDNQLAISDSGWKSILENNPNVSKSVQWKSGDFNPFFITQDQNVVYVAGIDNFGRVITPTSAIAQDIVYNYLRDRSSITDWISWSTSYIINAKFTINIKVTPTNLNQLKQNIKSDLIAKWKVINSEFRRNIYNSEVVKIIQSYDSVIYTNVTIEHVEYSYNNPDMVNLNPFFFKSTYRKAEVTERDNFIDISTGTTTKVWIRRKLGNAFSPWYIMGKQIVGGLIRDLPVNDPDYRGFSFGVGLQGTNVISIGGNVNDPFYNSTNIRVQQLIDLTAPIPSSLDPFLSTPFTSDQIINPTDLDPNGYQFRVTYQTKDQFTPVRFPNDIRLPFFNSITDINEDDIEFNILS